MRLNLFISAAVIALAAGLGESVAARHGLPVFLYREAARSSARSDLSLIRRGQFEGLAVLDVLLGLFPS